MNFKIVICLCFISLIGVLGKQARVFGGVSANIAEFPYLGLIRHQQNNQFICSVTIISNWNVLTTAHCIVPYEANLEVLKVATGTSSSAQIFGTYVIAEAHSHPFFQLENPLINDISVLKLATRIEFNTFQNRIALPTAPPQSGKLAFIAGWGLYESEIGSFIADRLRKVAVFTLRAEDCRRMVPYQLVDGHVCTYQRFGVGVCPGDAGGPVVVNGQIVGIITLSTHDCGNSTPDIHTSVYHYLNFIREFMIE